LTNFDSQEVLAEMPDSVPVVVSAGTHAVAHLIPPPLIALGLDTKVCLVKDENMPEEEDEDGMLQTSAEPWVPLPEDGHQPL